MFVISTNQLYFYAMQLVEKICGKCQLLKPITDFSKDKHSSIGFTYECKACRAKRSALWAAANPEKVKEANLKNRNKRKEFYSSPEGRKSSQRSWLKTTYGLSLEEYDAMLITQDYKCAICGGLDSKDRWGRLAVDHCHKTGKIRSLLCYKCNAGMGLLNDDKELLMKAFNYLTKHEPSITS